MEARYQQPVALIETFSQNSASSPLPNLPAVQELWSEVDGCPVRYLKCGSGHPLVLIHGLLGSAFCWRFNLQELASVRTVYALDLPGIGYSGRISERECSLKTNARRLLAFMQSCKIERADLLGNSHGGAIAMMAAILAPAKVHCLLLIAPVHPWMRERRLLIALAASSPGGWLTRRLAPHLGALHGYFLRRMYGDPRRIAPGTLEGYSAAIRIPGTINHLLAIIRGWEKDMQSLLPLLPQLRSISTLLMWGSLDAAVNPGSAGKLRDIFENCRLEIIPGAGHLPFEEFPTDFNQRILGFLAASDAVGV